jgi:tetratricopeptide (TPR) repeat protein
MCFQFYQRRSAKSAFPSDNTDINFHIPKRMKLRLSRFTLSVLLFVCTSVAYPQQSVDETISSAIRHQNLGLAYLEESQPHQAIEQFQGLVDLVPDESIGYGNLAVAHLRLKQREEAEKWVKRGLEVEPMDSQLYFILAEIHQSQSRIAEAVAAIQEAVKLAPDDLEARYRLARHFLSQRNDPEAMDEAIFQLQALRERTPANVVVLLKLANTLLRREQVEVAKRVCMELNALLWDADEEFLKYLKQGLFLIDQDDIKGAARYIQIFENVQKRSPRYQQGIGELVTNILGHPIEEFNSGFRARVTAKQTPAIGVNFVDATQEVGLGNLNGKRSTILLADYDNDGNLDLYTTLAALDTEPNLFRNEGGKFVPTTTIRQRADGVVSADIDKDGDPDLCLSGDGRLTLLHNDGAGNFTDITETAGFGGDDQKKEQQGRRTLLFVDYDHDGDLDLFTTGDRVKMYRNNADGVFSDVSDQTFLPSESPSVRDAGLADFDDDGDIDLFIVNDAMGCTLFTNLRQGKMQALTDAVGISQNHAFTAVAVGDYDNDGDIDLFIATDGETPHQLYRNRGGGIFVHDVRSHEGAINNAKGVRGSDARFIDYDNDGWLDLWFLGEPQAADGRGVFLFRNDGTGRFVNASNLLPETIRSGGSGTVGDYDNDGDLDLFLIDPDGGVVMLRNDGGDQNSWLEVKLEGVDAGNNKNNIDGIGSKVELKAGVLHQMKYVTDPVTHFGLGKEQQGDVLRVVWTNGVPQNVITPKSNQRILEKQVLKGSCPFLYVYDGSGYQFVTDLLWRSPLGMVTPMGFLADAETADYVKIPGELMQPRAGLYSIQVTEELWETAYFDLVKLLVVDHPIGTEIFTDERYTPPPFPAFKIYTAKEVHYPRIALDHHGYDVSDALKAVDYRYAIEHEPGRFQGVVDPHFIVLDLGDVPDDQELTLFLTGWIFPTDTSINLSLSQHPSINPAFPYLQVRDADGKWQTVINPIGIPAGKNKTICINLTDKFLSDDRQVKIATDMQIYWDSAFFAIGGKDVPMHVTTLSPNRADLHYRGFSKMYRPTPHAPHLFDHNDLETDQQWRDLAGHYTRYGDVTPLLEEIDDMYVIMNAGDEMTVEFDAEGLPPLEPGWKRDFILYSDGWDKDGDINTLTSQTVGPLPFHGMSTYPYPHGEKYPDTPEHLRYQLEYNTRRVTHELPRF